MAYSTEVGEMFLKSASLSCMMWIRTATGKLTGHRAAFAISDFQIMDGSLPRRAISLVLEWAFLHRDELAENWRRAERREDLIKIKPLD
jgi:hypothetical protein